MKKSTIMQPSSPWQEPRCIRAPMHPARRRCSSLKYSRYSRSSRLAGRAPRRSRCDAGLLPRAAGLGAAFAFLTIPALTLAHHGVGAQFDLSTSIELQGEVDRVIWRNPHVRITLRVANEAGGDDLWKSRLNP